MLTNSENYVSCEHFEARRFNAGIDLLREKQNELDDLFEKMRATVEEYDTRAHRFRMQSDADRKAHSHVSHLVLGETGWTRFLRRLHPDSERFQLGRLIHRDDVPWETIVDVEDEKVAAALGDLLDAIGPNAAEYFDKHLSSRRPQAPYDSAEPCFPTTLDAPEDDNERRASHRSRNVSIRKRTGQTPIVCYYSAELSVKVTTDLTHRSQHVCFQRP